jgi:hypothetical protein
MTRAKKLIVVAAVAMAGVMGVGGIASAHDHHHHHHNDGLVSSLLRTVGDVLGDL